VLWWCSPWFSELRDFPSILATIYSLLYQNYYTRCWDFASLPLVWPGGFTKAPSYSQRTSLITDSLLTFTTFSESSSPFTVSSECSSLQFVIKLETYLHKFMRRSIYGRTFASVLLNRVLIACLLAANCGKFCWKCLFWLPGFSSSTSSSIIEAPLDTSKTQHPLKLPPLSRCPF